MSQANYNVTNITREKQCVGSLFWNPGQKRGIVYLTPDIKKAEALGYFLIEEVGTDELDIIEDTLDVVVGDTVATEPGEIA